MSSASQRFKPTGAAKYPPLKANAHFDVMVIGGDNTGNTAAYLMEQAGLKVVLVERDHCGSVNARYPLAHLTYPTDFRHSKLLHKLGKDHAQAILDAGIS